MMIVGSQSGTANGTTSGMIAGGTVARRRPRSHGARTRGETRTNGIRRRGVLPQAAGRTRIA
eukprot:4036703-Amphidinium_carterae.1